MQRDNPAGRVDVGDVIDWTFSPTHEIRQPHRNGLFGEPPVTVFAAQRFYIEVLFWHSGTTSIHEHGFSGAFSVLAGSSVHSHWRFMPERTVNSRMSCGRLDRVSTEILRLGDMRPIHSGDRLIHQLFHLDQLSVTVVVRTYVERDRLPQFEYFSPGLAIDSVDDHDGLRTRRIVFLDAMARGHVEGLREYAARTIETCDVETIYHMFSMLGRREMAEDLLVELYATARRRHGEIMDLFREVCEGQRRVRRVVNLRSNVSDPKARFLLALLMLMPDRDAIFEAIRLEYPDAEPLATIEDLLEVMGGKETIGFELNGVNRHIFRSLVEGEDTERIFAWLRAEFQKESVNEERARVFAHAVLAHARKIAKLDLFRPLLSESPLRDENQAA